jgi:RimJ/RimL family protein N-acetyltransferase
METMPYRPEMDSRREPRAMPVMPVMRLTTEAAVSTDWKDGLPTLHGAAVVLRDLRLTDAPSLFAMLTTQEVSRFISPPPTSVEGFEGFIAWAIRQRRAGSYACFAITLAGADTAIGIFQLRQLAPGFTTAEWGFAMGSAYWGTGAYQDGAELVLAFAFDVVGVKRLEARAAVRNGRGNSALRKAGAVQECVLRQSFARNGERLDQVLWAILEEDWRLSRPTHFSELLH